MRIWCRHCMRIQPAFGLITVHTYIYLRLRCQGSQSPPPQYHYMGLLHPTLPVCVAQNNLASLWILRQIAFSWKCKAMLVTRRLGGPKSWSGHVLVQKKIPCPFDFDSRQGIEFSFCYHKPRPALTPTQPPVGQGSACTLPQRVNSPKMWSESLRSISYRSLESVYFYHTSTIRLHDVVLRHRDHRNFTINIASNNFV